MVRRIAPIGQGGGTAPPQFYEPGAPEQRRPEPQAQNARTSDTSAISPPAYGDAVGNVSRPRPAEKSHHGPPQPQARLADEEDSGSDLGVDTDEYEDDEEDWELDEASGHISNAGLPSYEESETLRVNETVDDLVRNVIGTLPPPVHVSDSKGGDRKTAPAKKPLPCPIIIPQRRPDNNAHGFVRAYPPLLVPCGIDQTAFMTFLVNFHKSLQSSPVFPAVQVAASIVAENISPQAIAMMATVAAATGFGMGPEAPAGHEVNNFLTRMNETVFQPAGLLAIIAKYKPDEEMQRTGRPGALTSLIRGDHVNFSAMNSAKPLYNRPEDAKQADEINERMRSVRLDGSRDRNPRPSPVAAPLVFPAVDRMLTTGVTGVVSNSLFSVGNVVSNYIDRRSQLNIPDRIPRRQVAYQNQDRAELPSLVSWATNGAYNPRQRLADRRMERQLDRDARRMERGRHPKHLRKSERRFGSNYQDELQARSEERMDYVSRSADANRETSSNQRAAAPYQPQNRHLQERGLLAGSLVADLLGVAANTVAHAAGSSTYHNADFFRSNSANAQPAARQDNQQYRDTRSETLFDQEVEEANQYDIEGIETVRRVLREDVLYLMVVNMPSEGEMAEAWEQLETAGFR